MRNYLNYSCDDFLMSRNVRAVKTAKTPKPAKPAKSVKTAKVVKTVKTPKVTNARTVRSKIEITKSDFKNNRFYLDKDSWIEYYPNFITRPKQKDLLIELTGSADLDYDERNGHDDTDVPWEHGIYSMFGKNIPTPRLLYAMRDDDADITKSYSVTDSIEWTPEMEKLRDRVAKKTNRSYRYAQMNYYRTGNDYIGFHTDSEVQSGDLIASVSLGTTRRFRFRSIDYKNNSIPIYWIDLEPGSLLVMSEHAAKHNWKHELMKDKNTTESRINITYRPN